MDHETMSKSAFARHIGVSPARITQYINEGTLDQTAMLGEGRSAKIKVGIAERLISERRDPTQALVNGTAELDGDDDLFDGVDENEGSIVQPNVTKSSPRNALDLSLKELKVERELRANARARRQDAIEDGRLVPAEDLVREVSLAVTRTMQVFEGAVPEIARQFAANFDVPQRDAEHLLRSVLGEVREKESKREADRADELPDTKELVLTEETIQ